MRVGVWYVCNHPHMKKGGSNEGARAWAGVAKTWLQILLEDLLQSRSLHRRKLGSLNLASLNVLKLLF